MIPSYLIRRWRPILVCLMVLGFFLPWIPSRISPYGNWGNTPHYLVEYDRLSGGLPTGDLGAGYFHPEVYYGFEVVWIYLIGFLHFLGFHTFLFPIGLVAVLIVIYNLMSLSIYFYGSKAMTRLISRAKLTSILCIITLALEGLQSFSWFNKDFKVWHFAGYMITFIALFTSLIFEFKKIDTTPAVPKPTLWLNASITLVVSSLFLPIVFLPPPSTSATASDCDMLNEFVVPASRWANMDENALQTWIEESPNFDNLVDKGPFGNLGHRLTWYAYEHHVGYDAFFKEHQLRSISATVGYRGITLDLALTCYGEPDAYIAYREEANPHNVGLLLVQLWYPTKGIVLSNSILGSDAESTAVDERLPMDVYFVQPGSIEEIVDRAYLGIQKGDGSFPWIQFIKPWPGSPQEIQVIEITE